MSTATQEEIRHSTYAELIAAKNSRELFDEYAAECAVPELGRINPQDALYEQMESSGMLQVFTVFERDTLIGCAIVLFYVVPHHGKKMATVESIFIDKAHRAGGIGQELMWTIEQEARARDCVAIGYSAPAGGQLERLLSARKTYRRTSSVFIRKLS